MLCVGRFVAKVHQVLETRMSEGSAKSWGDCFLEFGGGKRGFEGGAVREEGQEGEEELGEMHVGELGRGCVFGCARMW